MSDNTKLTVSDHNLQTINTSEYEETLVGSIQSGSNLAIFGHRGFGKTAIAKQTVALTKIEVNKKLRNVREVYINLSVVERPDMAGYPLLFQSSQDLTDDEKRKKFIDYMLPKFFEPMIIGDQPVVIIFDEVDKADPSIWAPLLEILQFKSINYRQLTNLQCCLLTGNLISEGSQRPSLPLLDRTEAYLLKADPSAFQAWAAKSNKIHPSVRTFLSDKPNYLFGSNDGVGDLYKEPSPRGWEYASKVLAFGEENRWSKELINRKISGFVGKQAGLEYEIYYEHYRELLPLIGKIFEGANPASEYKQLDPSKQIYVAMIACARLSAILDEAKEKFLQKSGDKASPQKPENHPKELSYLGSFLDKNVSDENVLISVRSQLTLERMIYWNTFEANEWKKMCINIANINIPSIDKK